jgi:hypothetical protein
MLNQVQMLFSQRAAAALRLALLVSLPFLLIGLTRACPLCLGISVPAQTLADRLIAGSEVVLALPVSTGDGKLQVKMVLKGDASLEGQELAVADATASQSSAGFALLVSDSVTSSWTNLGKVGLSLLPFLKRVLALPSTDKLTDGEWTARLGFFQPYLESFDPRLAASAWVEWTRAPYRSLRTAQLDREKLRSWLDDSANPERHALWFVLLGLCGNQDDAVFIADRVHSEWREGKDTNLAAMLSAQIELTGAAAVDFIEHAYICDRNRTLEEIQAAISALSVVGREGTPELHPRIVRSFHLMLQQRRPLAGFVARDLATWGEWDVWSDFAQMLRSGEPIYPSARPAIVDYLRNCPLPKAQEAVRSLGLAPRITIN